MEILLEISLLRSASDRGFGAGYIVYMTYIVTCLLESGRSAGEVSFWGPPRWSRHHFTAVMETGDVRDGEEAG